MKALRTLVVDDDLDFTDGLASLVQACGHDAVVLTSGQAAVSTLRDQAFDIAFVDVRMPDVSGFDVVHAIKSGKVRCEILLMTAFKLEDALSEEVDYGAVAVVSEPYSDEAFYAAFDRVLPDGIVVVVDDKPQCSTRLAEILANKGHKVEVDMAVDNLRARLRAPERDTLILDLGVPVIDAMDAYATVKHESRGTPTVIVVRATPDPEHDILRSREATGLLFKPFDVEPILDARARTV